MPQSRFSIWRASTDTLNLPVSHDRRFRGKSAMRLRLYLLSLGATVGISAAAASAETNTIVLTVGPGGQYQTVSAAVSRADADTAPGNHYDIQIMPGTYTNDFPYVTRPMTIEVNPNYPGQAVVLKATENLPKEKGIIITIE